MGAGNFVEKGKEEGGGREGEGRRKREAGALPQTPEGATGPFTP